jgi:hypothetical protein
MNTGVRPGMTIRGRGSGGAFPSAVMAAATVPAVADVAHRVSCLNNKMAL